MLGKLRRNCKTCKSRETDGWLSGPLKLTLARAMQTMSLKGEAKASGTSVNRRMVSDERTFEKLIAISEEVCRSEDGTNVFFGRKRSRTHHCRRSSKTATERTRRK